VANKLLHYSTEKNVMLLLSMGLYQILEFFLR